MVLIKEYRVVLPVTVEEYHIGQLYAVARCSKEMSGKKERVEILVNEPYENAETGEKGQYTKKIYYIAKRVPAWIRWAIPAKWMQLHEEAWNAFPICKTVLTTPALKNFEIKVETIHAEGAGEIENIHNVGPDILKKREVVMLDVVNDPIDKKDYVAAEDPKLATFPKTNRGPWGPDWIRTSQPVMTCYKLVTVLCKIWGFQGKLERNIHNQQVGLLRKFHRQVVCWLDEWVELTIEDIRRMEAKIAAELLGLKEVVGDPDLSDTEEDGEEAGSSSAAAPEPEEEEEEKEEKK